MSIASHVQITKEWTQYFTARDICTERTLIIHWRMIQDHQGRDQLTGILGRFSPLPLRSRIYSPASCTPLCPAACSSAHGSLQLKLLWKDTQGILLCWEWNWVFLLSMSRKYGFVMFCLNFFENFNVGTKKAVKRFKLSMHVIL